MQHCFFSLVAFAEPETTACCVVQASTTLMRKMNRSAHNERLAHCWLFGCCSHGVVLVVAGLYTRWGLQGVLFSSAKTMSSYSTHGFLIRYCKREVWALILIPVVAACGLPNDCKIISQSVCVCVCVRLCVCVCLTSYLLIQRMSAHFGHCKIHFGHWLRGDSIEAQLFTAVNIGSDSTINAPNCVCPRVTENKVRGRAV